MVTVNLGGYFLFNALLKGDGIATVLRQDELVFTILLAWWLMYYCPFDAVYRAFCLRIVNVSVDFINTWKQWFDIRHAVAEGQRYAPTSFVAPLVFGIVGSTCDSSLKMIS